MRRTTFEIPDDLHREARHAAFSRGITFRELLLTSLRQHLSETSRRGTRPGGQRVRTGRDGRSRWRDEEAGWRPRRLIGLESDVLIAAIEPESPHHALAREALAQSGAAMTVTAVDSAAATRSEPDPIRYAITLVQTSEIVSSASSFGSAGAGRALDELIQRYDIKVTIPDWRASNWRWENGYGESEDEAAQIAAELQVAGVSHVVVLNDRRLKPYGFTIGDLLDGVASAFEVTAQA